MNPNLTLLHAYSPSGHSSVSAALIRQLKNTGGAVSEIEIVSDLHPFWGPMLTRAYLELVQKTPKLWDYLYDNQIVAQALAEFKNELTLMQRKKLREALKKLKTDVAICTHALPCAILAVEKQNDQMQIPLIGVITDFGVHAYWISDLVDLYLAPTNEVKKELIRRGVSGGKIEVTGIPIDAAFAELPSKSEARKTLRLEPGRPLVLIAGGTKGIGPIRDIVGHLLARSPEVHLAVVCGTNKELFDWLSERCRASSRVRVLGYIKDMAQYMAAADILIGKAGGVTASEALAAGLPMIILAPLPGQEERNSAYLVSQEAAKRVETHDELADCVASLLSSSDLRAMRDAALKIAHPRSAEAACRSILRAAR